MCFQVFENYVCRYNSDTYDNRNQKYIIADLMKIMYVSNNLYIEKMKVNVYKY